MKTINVTNKLALGILIAAMVLTRAHLAHAKLIFDADVPKEEAPFVEDLDPMVPTITNAVVDKLAKPTNGETDKSGADSASEPQAAGATPAVSATQTVSAVQQPISNQPMSATQLPTPAPASAQVPTPANVQVIINNYGYQQGQQYAPPSPGLPAPTQFRQYALPRSLGFPAPGPKYASPAMTPIPSNPPTENLHNLRDPALTERLRLRDQIRREMMSTQETNQVAQTVE